MAYKVFFVEDEIITREGIRDNVDWQANGFELCGEASDGEMALPLLRTAQPDVLITDIKMPFMDGLQLSRIMRESMPWVKIIILSGHDEFEYAQQAIKLGVTDYLLKPITVQKLQDALEKLTVQLNREKKEQEDLQKLQRQADENRVAQREKFLFKLVVGAVSPVEAIENGHSLGLNLIARYYQVAILKISSNELSETLDQDDYQRLQNNVSYLIDKDPDVFMLKRDMGDLVLIFKGSTPEFLEEGKEILLEGIKREIGNTPYQLVVGAGCTKKRIADICKSFAEALACIQNPDDDLVPLNQPLEHMELLKVDKSMVEGYLRSGTKEECSNFFDTYILPLGETALKSNLIKNYVFMDVVLSVAKLVNDLGGDIDTMFPELDSIELILANIKTTEQMRERICHILSTTLEYRDNQSGNQYKDLLHQAREYIKQHYKDPELSLNTVAVQANLSASHFSMVFSQEVGQTFKEYITELRINKAKELLRMTGLRSADIAFQVGYNDPHYFSSVFKKHTGLSPLEFRSQV